ncbi:fructose-1,6-bisphosphatase [Alkaliphilus metalliredigens QYMF]|uniref:Fructose-1,6-bisphosphatase class 3 n=1 Tax=Alkaliphilus metalliredigens (strain QYMF) TaxID=293826 RepID=F16PC_ALKMQ|nr:fructose-1,6-bisphosphatase [Alkaliphilus metalliredigens]A6TLX6.1 RecName: Full=Fructose-1,6-bisphosphatase class 3; Short=FBPase class 3; AltName: Full=D-fructose-1,6-bisphosphate 1-phosphohydrolase class 3 [Alkaliphilus metalliredigens QYMF]ABR47194.1 fructose-1,6-bisphosphatase [Alkaliphilus metalliredigens QYMF]
MVYSNNDVIQDFGSDLRYLKLLSKEFPTIASASTEIINLQAILNLPKGTEHFLSDIHGEYESFNHVLKNGSGNIKRKIIEVFGDLLSETEIKSLATLIYYPEQKLDLIHKKEENIEEWYKVTISRLVEVCRKAAFKYTRMKVRKALPKDFAYIIEELMHRGPKELDKEEYYNEIIETIIRIGRADEFIIEMSKLIQRLVIDRLHIVGDIFDRGPGPDIVMDTLLNYHSVDIQWGNHDVLWMGSAAGSEACIATLIRICATYSNLNTIEDGYGINLLPLATFALDFYKDDDCTAFKPKIKSDIIYTENDLKLIAKMHKAISIIQFKLEGEIINRRPHFSMEDRLLLNKINYEDGTVDIDGKIYKLKDSNFPTINPKNPYKLTIEEKELMEKLKSSFLNSEKLQRHVRFLFSNGSMYLKFNSNLMYHGGIPMNEDGSFKKVTIDSSGISYSGKAYFDRLEILVREAYFRKNNPIAKQHGMDITWYLWTGPDSPLFGKDKMTTFERYFINDKETHVEKKDPYFKLEDNEKMCRIIFEEFGLNPDVSHIINGHVPVKLKEGESPIRANGKLLVIDGGFSRTYQGTTGIAGYTLIYNSYGLLLVSHDPFESTQKAIEEEKDIHSTTMVLEKEVERKRVRDTDDGEKLKFQVKDLEMLLDAYRSGLIKEQR